MDPWTIFMHTNHLGSTSMVTDPTGAVSQKELFYPYGQNWVHAGGQTLTWRFASLREGLPGSGDLMSQSETRDYPSRFYRWLSPDPSMESAKLRNPQTWNRYSYGINNPLRFIDPNGELWVAASGGSYSWVDQCAKDQTCYQSVAGVQDNNLVIYGSNNAQDITKIAASDGGYVDLNAVSGQHDAAFEMKDGVTASYLTLENAADFYNATADYSASFPDDAKFVVTDAGNSDGSAVERHDAHDSGRAADLRYTDSKGKGIQSATASDSADAGRLEALTAFAGARGFNQNYTQVKNIPGTIYRATDHKNHFHISKIKPPNR